MKAIKVNITTFINPYSFFCVINESNQEISLKSNNEEHAVTTKSISDVNHGQYVAVMWKNKWTRGVITMESQFLIWLIDYGIFIHPDDKSVYVDLPIEYRKYPTKVFEAAIHGVVPVDKYISDEFLIDSKVSSSWNKGSIEKCQELIRDSTNIYFVPLALMSTKFNDIVLGDLYLEIPGKKIINIIHELEMWPVFLEKNKSSYVEMKKLADESAGDKWSMSNLDIRFTKGITNALPDLSKYYITRRKHRACILKPEFADGLLLPGVTLEMTLKKYNTVLKNQPDISMLLQRYADLTDEDSESETQINDSKTKDAYRLTPGEIEKYSNLYVTVHGHKYNVLNVLVNKARDLRMCERYKDLKSIGRGYSFRGHRKDK